MGLQRSKKRIPLVPKTNGQAPAIPVDLPKRRERTVQLNIESLSPLISHAWSSKAVKMMLGKQMGEASAGRTKKDPFQDFVESLYVCQNGQFGMPAPCFKACGVSAANDVGLKMTEMRRAFHVKTYTIPIVGPPITQPLNEWDEKYWDKMKPYASQGVHARMDLVRLESGVADVRFRGEWPIWKCTLEIDFNEAVISLDQLVNLMNAGGYGSGIGEWRPSSPVVKSGEFGRFRVV